MADKKIYFAGLRNLGTQNGRIRVIFNQLVILMKTAFPHLFIILLVFMAGAGCTDSNSWDTDEDVKTSKSDDQDQRDDRNSNRNSNQNNSDDEYPDTELGNALNELGNAFEEMGKAFGNDTNVEPVDFRELRALLPEEIRGMEKGKSNGERTGALGFRISQVEQTYEEENGDGKLEISIVDLGGLKNVAAMGLDWLNVDVDRESDDGYERTRTYRDHPVMDKCEQTGRYDKCEMTAFISRRFVVSLKSQGLERGRLEDILEEVDIRKLERMKDEGVDED